MLPVNRYKDHNSVNWNLHTKRWSLIQIGRCGMTVFGSYAIYVWGKSTLSKKWVFHIDKGQKLTWWIEKRITFKKQIDNFVISIIQEEQNYIKQSYGIICFIPDDHMKTLYRYHFASFLLWSILTSDSAFF